MTRRGGAHNTKVCATSLWMCASTGSGWGFWLCW
jgi:hypothetical protein